MDELERSIETWYARMERQLRGYQAEGDTESLRLALDHLERNVKALMARYEPGPEDVPPHRGPTSAFKPSHTFGRNY